MSNDTGTSGESIRCPKCGEENMAADVRCWACDAELHPAPEQPEPAKAEPAEEEPLDVELGPVVPDNYLGHPSRASLSAQAAGPTLLTIGLFAAGAILIILGLRSAFTAYQGVATGHTILHSLAAFGGSWEEDLNTPWSQAVTRVANPGEFRDAILDYLVWGAVEATAGAYLLRRAWRSVRAASTDDS